MALAGLGRRLGSQAGSTQFGETPNSPGSLGVEVTLGEERQAGSGPEPQPEPEAELEPEPELQEELAKDEEQLEPRGPRPPAPILPLRASHGLKRKPTKVEAELQLQLQHTDWRRTPLRKEDSDGGQGEPCPPVKQHKKAKKRKSLGVPPPLATTTVVSTPAETLGLERKAQRLRPLYQYINYSNPELNQAGEGEAEVEVDLGLVPEEASGGPEEASSEKPQVSPLGEEGGEEPVPIMSFAPASQLKAEVDKSTQVDIDKMLSVCAAHLVPPLSPQYK